MMIYEILLVMYSHPSKAMVAAQRRLFPPTKENASPQRKLVPLILHLGIDY